MIDSLVLRDAASTTPFPTITVITIRTQVTFEAIRGSEGNAMHTPAIWQTVWRRMSLRNL